MLSRLLRMMACFHQLRFFGSGAIVSLLAVYPSILVSQFASSVLFPVYVFWLRGIAITKLGYLTDALLIDHVAASPNEQKAVICMYGLLSLAANAYLWIYRPEISIPSIGELTLFAILFACYVYCTFSAKQGTFSQLCVVPLAWTVCRATWRLEMEIVLVVLSALALSFSLDEKTDKIGPATSTSIFSSDGGGDGQVEEDNTARLSIMVDLFNAAVLVGVLVHMNLGIPDLVSRWATHSSSLMGLLSFFAFSSSTTYTSPYACGSFGALSGVLWVLLRRIRQQRTRSIWEE
ncbi:putative mitochondrial protein [Andalucia godoyi]|uniref:Putative mitochondrial protein n=1 Tax=Andalucia godoyi TaxID=505711 RepID=A0A8K0AHN3_ANDGO|nr:putative mitochondrial protein [Andalucia godoyi]|eukprot:ANDGO_05373.mRNA.1 putative mitochondrial protein